MGRGMVAQDPGIQGACLIESLRGVEPVLLPPPNSGFRVEGLGIRVWGLGFRV